MSERPLRFRVPPLASRGLALVGAGLGLAAALTAHALPDPYRIDEEAWGAIAAHYAGGGPNGTARVPAATVELWRDFAVASDPGPRPPVGNEGLAALGLLDVTAAPFGADPSGKRDSTAALNAALRFANVHRLAVFLPAGDYRVSDTVQAPTLLRVDWDGRLNRAGGHGPVVIGSTADPRRRARLVLAAGSPGFGDPHDLKAVVRFWRPSQPAVGRHPQEEQNNDAYDFLLRDVDIVIEPGNDGAVALRFQGAEGVALQDVTLDLSRGGHTGLVGLPGSGGSVAGLEVRGGRVGIDANLWQPDIARPGHGSLRGQGSQPGATISDLRLYGQTEFAVRSNVRGQLVIAGLDLRTGVRGPVIDLPVGWGPFENVLALVDARIEYAEPHAANTVVSEGKSFYLENVYGRHVASFGGGEASGPAPAGWARVRQLACARPAPARGTLLQPTEAVWRDGGERAGAFYRAEPVDGPPDAEVLARHRWGAGFPSFETAGAANVRAFGARGDGVADDTAAFERAIAAADVVLVPKGEYRVSRTLELRPETKLVGLHHSLSILVGRENREFGRFGGANADSMRDGRPVLSTPDDPDATNVLAFLGVRASATYGPNDPTPVATYSLLWRAGARAMVRGVDFTPLREGAWNEWVVWERAFGKSREQVQEAQRDPLRRFHSYRAFPERPGPAVAQHSRVKVSGHGGGRWWNFWMHGYYPLAEPARLLEVRGTAQPLRFYHLHGQHTHTSAVFEISDARDVAIYGTKTETHGRFLDVVRSERIRIYGMGGAFGPGFDEHGVSQPYYRIVDSRDWLIAAMGQQVHVGAHDDRRPGGNRFPLVALRWDTYPPIEIVAPEGATLKLPGNARPVLLQSGSPVD